MTSRRSFLKFLACSPVVGSLPVSEAVSVPVSEPVMDRYAMEKFDHSLYGRARVRVVKPSGSADVVYSGPSGVHLPISPYKRSVVS